MTLFKFMIFIVVPLACCPLGNRSYLLIFPSRNDFSTFLLPLLLKKSFLFNYIPFLERLFFFLTLPYVSRIFTTNTYVFLWLQSEIRTSCGFREKVIQVANKPFDEVEYKWLVCCVFGAWRQKYILHEVFL